MRRSLVVVVALCGLLVGCVTGRTPYAGLPQSLDVRSETVAQDTSTAWTLSALLDPRAGPMRNSGYGLTTGEVVRTVVPLAGVLFSPWQVVEAGQGRTETEHTYYHNLEPSSGRRALALAQYFHEAGKLTNSEYEGFLRSALASSPGPDPALLAMIPEELLRPGAISAGSRWLVHWPDPAGIAPAQARLLLKSGTVTPEDLNSYFVWRLARAGGLPLPPDSLLTAEAIGTLPKEEVDRQLRRRFWVIFDSVLYDRKRALQRDPWRESDDLEIERDEKMVRRVLEAGPAGE